MPYVLTDLCNIYTGIGGIPQTPARHTNVPCRLWPDIRVWRNPVQLDSSVPFSHVLVIDDPLVMDGQSGHLPNNFPGPDADWILLVGIDTVAYIAVFATTIFRSEADQQQRILLARYIGNSDDA